MSYQKCPRCNLNYITDGESLCRICDQELGRGGTSKTDDEDEICALCGENVVAKGKDLCASCMREHMATAVKPVESWDYSEDSDGVQQSDTAADERKLMPHDELVDTIGGERMELDEDDEAE